ncbi:MAG: hypothetical protein PHS95_02355 [Candidatus Pacebacteria bacterium]|nr:hypothetical protein [Candidatus Paceibacterota bacterium]
MNIEHLTKSQIVLLTLFVSFVSSMATGIVVVTLMQQAPEPVLQSITNVVKTIEKGIPVTVEKPGKTIIVKDEDLMVSAIAQNSKSVFALRTYDSEGNAVPVGVGTIVSSEGLVITDKVNFDIGTLTAKVGGIQYVVKFISSSKDNNLALGKLVPVDLAVESTATTSPALATSGAPDASGSTTQTASAAGKIVVATSTPPVKVTFAPVVLGSSDTIKVGQTAIVIGGRDGQSIVTGLITSLDTSTTEDKNTKVLNNINLSQKLSSSYNGAPIITLDGAVVGFVSIDEIMGIQAGLPVNDAKKLISAELAPAPTPVSTTKKTQ